MNFIKYLDYNTLFFIQNHVQNDFLNPIIIFFTKLGNSGFIWILISIILIMKSKYRKIGFLVLSVLFINTLFGEILLKHLIQRPRPFITLSNLNIIIEKPSSFSFPSGHTSSAFACAFIFGYFFKKYKWYLEKIYETLTYIVQRMDEKRKYTGRRVFVLFSLTHTTVFDIIYQVIKYSMRE